MSSPEYSFYNVSAVRPVDTSVTPRTEAIVQLRNNSLGAPDWTYTNVSNAPVTIQFGTSVFSHRHQMFMPGPEVRIRWAVGESVAIPACFAVSIHDVRVPVGATSPTCAGGQAPWQLARTSPKQDYEIHRSLLPNAAAERAAVTKLTPEANHE